MTKNIATILLALLIIGAGRIWACDSKGDSKPEADLAAKICGSEPFIDFHDKITGVYVFKFGDIPTMRINLTKHTCEYLRADQLSREVWVDSLLSDLNDLKEKEGGQEGVVRIYFEDGSSLDDCLTN